MTYNSDRLDRMEALLATTIEGLARTEKITESNARAIEAWSSRIEEGIEEAEEVSSATAANTNRRMEDAIADTVTMIANLGQQQQETDQRFNNLLEESRADRQRFDQLLEEARADRQRADRDRALNESEHRAFRETFQTMLAQIAQLWQRVAG